MIANERLKHLRQIKYLKQGEFVTDICSITTISRIEHLDLPASSDLTQKFAKKWDVPEIYLTKEHIFELLELDKLHQPLLEQERVLLELCIRTHPPTSILLAISAILLNHYIESDSLHAENFYEQIKEQVNTELFDEKKLQQELINYYRALGRFHYWKQNFIYANIFYKKAVVLLGEETTTLNAALCYNLGVSIFQAYQDSCESMSYLERSLSIYEQLHILSEQSAVLSALAICYHHHKMYDKALELLFKAKNIVDDPLELFSVENNIGNVYQSMNDFDKALIHFEQSLQVNNHFEERAIHTLESMLNIFLIQKDWKNMNHYLTKALLIVSKYPLERTTILIHFYHACFQLSKRNSSFYEKQMKRLLEEAEEKNYIPIAEKLSIHLGNYYYQKNAYKKSATYLRKSLIFSGNLSE